MENELIQQAKNPIVYDDYTGLENVETKDLITPRLFTPGGTSKIIAEGKANVGDICISTDNSVFIPRGEHALFVPIFQYQQCIEWDAKQTGKYPGNIISQTLDKDNPLFARAENFEKTINKEGKEVLAVTKYWNILAIFSGKESYGLICISCARSNYKTAKVFMTQAKAMRTPDGKGMPLFGNVCKLYTVPTERRGYKFHTLAIDFVGVIASQEQFSYFRQASLEASKSYNKMPVVHTQEMDTEAEDNPRIDNDAF